MRPTLLLLLLLGFSATCPAAVYKWVDEAGNTVFGDNPPEQFESEEVVTQPANTYQTPQTNKPPSHRTMGKYAEPHSGYERLTITSPQDGQTIRSDGGQISVALDIHPPLNTAAGHQLRITLDGVEAGRAQATTITLQAVSRGSRSLQADIIDQQGNTLQSSTPIRFHLHRRSVIR